MITKHELSEEHEKDSLLQIQIQNPSAYVVTKYKNIYSPNFFFFRYRSYSVLYIITFKPVTEDELFHCTRQHMF